MSLDLEPSRNGYLIGDLLGEGGMGRVFEAVRSWDGLHVAFKVLRADSQSAGARRTLVNEALATARLGHPNLVAVLDVGEHPELGVFLVQELVMGTSLDATLAQDEHVDGGIDALIAVLEGLTAAHAGGVVHGDLKPSNVLLTASGLVKLCDFGVAQSLGPRKDASGRRIRAGTPQYMAPEQFETAVDLDPRADLYAVGAMLYQVLTGLLPHRNTESIEGILDEKRAGVPRPRFDRAGRPIPREMGDLVVAMTEPDLRRRPRFAAEVLERLRASSAALRVIPIHPASTPRPAPAPSAPPSAGSAGTVLLPTRPFSGPPSSSAPTSVGFPPRSREAPGSHAMPTFVPASHLPGTAFIHVRPPTLVGRTREISVLRHAMRDAIDARDVRAVVLEGEEGVGKSRLAEWALGECERTGLMEGVAARFSPEGGSPARGLRGMLARLFAPASVSLGAGARATAAWLGDRVAEAGLDAEALASWLSTSTEDDAIDPHTAAAMSATALRAYAGARPLYLWLDDLLWANDGTFELAMRLLAGGVGPIVLVVTCNEAATSDERGRQRHAGLMAHRLVQRIDLRRLDAPGRAALLRAAAPLSRALAEGVAESLDATPLVLVQLVSDWLDRGLLSPSPDGLQSLAGVHALFDARTPTDVFRYRLMGLLDAVREAAPVLYAAALLGPWCTARSLHGVGAALGLDEEAVDLVLEESIVRGILRAEGGDAYRLEHQVFRVVLARAAASDTGYPRLCAAVAQSLLQVHGRERPDVRAYAAIWLRDSGDRSGAATMLLEASDGMARGGDLEAAARQVNLARRWLDEETVPADDPRRDLLLYVDARVAYFGLAYDEALQGTREAAIRFAARGAHDLLLRARNLELRILFYADRISECEELIGVTRREFRSAIYPGSYSQLHHLHLAADLHVLRGDLRGARDLLRTAVRDYEEKESWYRAILMCDLATSEAAVGDFSAAEAALDELRRGRGALDVYQLHILREIEHAVALLSGQRGPRAFHAEQVEDKRTRGDRWGLTSMRLQLALYDLRFGEPTATASTVAALDSFAIIPHDEAMSHAVLIAIARHLAARGDHDLAARAESLLAARHRVGQKRVALGSIPSGSGPIGPTKPSSSG